MASETDIAHAGQVWLRLQAAGYKDVGVQVVDGDLTLVMDQSLTEEIKTALHDEIRANVDLTYHEPEQVT